MIRARVTQETRDAASKCLNRNNGDPDDRADKIQPFEGMVKVTITGASDEELVLAQNDSVIEMPKITIYFLLFRASKFDKVKRWFWIHSIKINVDKYKSYFFLNVQIMHKYSCSMYTADMLRLA